MELLGRVVQSPIKLTQDKQEFKFKFCSFAVRFSVRFYCLAFSLELSNLKLHKTKAVKNICIKEKLYFASQGGTNVISHTSNSE